MKTIQGNTLAFSTFVDANSVRYWLFLLGIYVFLGAVWQWYAAQNAFVRVLLAIVIHLPLHLPLDVLNFFYGICYYDPEVCIQRGYSVSAFNNDTLHSVGLDYGFNFYDGDYEKSRTQAQLDKFQFAIKQLGIKRGDSVIDIGCGCGDWLYYLQQEYGCKVVGVNITEQQVLECRSRGLKETLCNNWKDIAGSEKLRKQLYARFDAVSFWDTVEHYVPINMHHSRQLQDGVYKDMFVLAKNLLRKRDCDDYSGTGRIWISCLHMHKRVFQSEKLLKFDVKQLHKMWYCYILDKFHSGFYPSNYFDKALGRKRDQLVENAQTVGLECTWRRDVTYDYYITSVLEPTHFGRHRFAMTVPRLLYGLTWVVCDPMWLHRIVWFLSEDWMFQFDPKDIGNSDVILWWLTFSPKLE